MEQDDYEGYQYYIKDLLSLTEAECKPHISKGVFDDLKASQLCLVDFEPKTNDDKLFLESAKRMLLETFSYLYGSIYTELRNKGLEWRAERQ